MSMDFKGLEIKFELNGVTYERSLEEDLEIDKANIDDEFCNQPERYAWWSLLAEAAKDRVACLKNELEYLAARIDSKARNENFMALADPKTAKSTPKMTEKMYEHVVVGNKEYQDLMTQYLEARRQAGMLAKGMEAFAQRKDMLISLGANYRMEMNADPRVMSEENELKAKRRLQERVEARQAAMSSSKKPVKTKVPVKSSN